MKEQTTLGNMHEKRFNSHFTSNPIIIPIKNGEFDKEDISFLKEITKDAMCTVKEREKNNDENINRM